MESRNRFSRQYLQNLNALIFWFKYLQKVNAKWPQISDEKKSFASLTNDFWSIKKLIKKYLSMEQNLCFFFIRNLRAFHLLFAGTYIRIWGHLYSAGIALQLYSALRFERLKRVQKSRAIPCEFWDEVFSLLMPLVCPHLTAVRDIPVNPYTSLWELTYRVFLLSLTGFESAVQNCNLENRGVGWK